jgi:hypothetical protein
MPKVSEELKKDFSPIPFLVPHSSFLVLSLPLALALQVR